MTALEWLAYDASPETARLRWACFRPESGQPSPVGRPVRVTRGDGLSSGLRGRYCFSVQSDDGAMRDVHTTLYEEELIRVMYTNTGVLASEESFVDFSMRGAS